jgi:5-methylcytosine-specific restriction endonuclease McrA
MLHQTLLDILVLNNLALAPKKPSSGRTQPGRPRPSPKTCYKRIQKMRKHWDGLCSYCGERTPHLTGDHVIPRSHHGVTRISNIVPACGACNNAKGDKSLLMFLLGRAS